LVIVADFEKASSDRYLISHYDTFTYALDIVTFALNRTVVKMVCCHLE
jgi:hypothetical protein